MDDEISDDDWDLLAESHFDTNDLLDAVDAVDSLRDHLNDGEGHRPPELRTDLLKLHKLAMAVFREGSRGSVEEMFDAALDLEGQVDAMMEALEKIRDTLSELTAMHPDNRA